MILVLHQGALGDFILTLSIIQAVRSTLNARHVQVIASSAAASLAAGRSAVDACLHPESVGLHTLFAEAGPLDHRLQAALDNADLVLNFLADAQSNIHHRLTRATAAHVVSVDPRPTPQTLSASIHITRQWAQSLADAGLPLIDPQPPVIRLTDHTPIQTPPDKRTVVIHPGSGGRAKCWPVENFIALADTLSNARIVWMVGPAELETNRPLTTAVRNRVETHNETLIAEPDLEQAARTLLANRPALYIGNDAGTTHLAAALNIPTIAIFTTTNPKTWKPQGRHITIIQPNQTQPLKLLIPHMGTLV